ncbi:MAG: hypothetical protein AAGI52_10095 [Bacteroidota bacterium]
MRTLVAFFLLAMAAPPATAQFSLADARNALDRAVHANDLDSLRAARAGLQLVASGDGTEADWARYYTALADYRLTYALWGADPDAAAQHARLGSDALADLRRQSAGDLLVESTALHVAMMGARMGLDPSLGMSLGASSQRAQADASRLAPDNPRVQFVEATALLNTPPEWGGDPERAKTLLQSALATFEAGGSDGDALAPDWGHGDVAAWLGMAHLMSGDPAAARPHIERAEELDPNSDFVRYKLKGWLAQLESETAAN